MINDVGSLLVFMKDSFMGDARFCELYDSITRNYEDFGRIDLNVDPICLVQAINYLLDNVDDINNGISEFEIKYTLISQSNWSVDESFSGVGISLSTKIYLWRIC